MEGKELVSSGCDLSFAIISVLSVPFLQLHIPVSQRRAAKLVVVKIIEPKSMVIAMVEVVASPRTLLAEEVSCCWRTKDSLSWR